MEPEKQKKQTPAVLIFVVIAAFVVFGLVVLAVAAAIVVPGLMRTRERANDVMCEHNLKEIYRAAFLYRDENRSFPHTPEGSEATLNLLLASPAGSGLTPGTFICPHADDRRAQILRGSFRVDSGTTSYWIVNTETRPADRGILLVDRKPHPNGTRQAVFADGTCRTIPEEEFQRDYAQLFK